MERSELHKKLSEMANKQGLEYFIKEDQGNLITIHFWVEDDKNDNG